jgi:quercetin dioxygenase-like cupin family protein
MAEEHSYLRTHKLSGNVLTIDTATEEAKLVQQAVASRTGRAAKTFVKEGRLRVTLVALRKGTALGAHSVDGDITLHVLRGQFEVRTQDRTVRAGRGQVISLLAGVSHEAHAARDSSVLITTSLR